MPGFDKDQTLNSPLYPFSTNSLLALCCYHGSVNCFKFLITEFDSPITQDCLLYSFLSGNPDIIHKCLKAEQPNETCMEYAIISHNIDFVTFLMNEYGLEINLMECIKYHNFQAFLVYLDQTDDINQCFIYSACFHNPCFCEYFLSKGADVNSKTEDWGQTAIFYATEYDNEKTAEFLISHGADINVKDFYSNTALHRATDYNYNNEGAKFLILHGADVNSKDSDAYTALHLAAEINNNEMVEFLVEHGADVNAKNKYGGTALHFGSVRNNEEIVDILILHGADGNANKCCKRIAATKS
ncbi:ankyrin repeat protein, putative [Trichomonas vaginalis G3]|uniref:Ankyrin repeat protein, putative n=1 Tax=Trichomonas vaginalis (strain ATCC PRA-98 / G3) TaxID=412133 RepID=A2EDF9_TRIV3|nr:protein ubiquitination [Trichomonas vaginalis G3]EAY09323.1 ankyrin repeat protein, putative [Trichomonas vaginalis G3]KAI5510838.1 protein ubiquitination [Trichomonas vaginalis G3]|eukprot:XP_001321546.1 ankyrin repeat protein [Trichomonas vaginalis G3]